MTVKDRERNGQRTAPRIFPKNAIFGDGEMARLTRAFDWSRTPVGPIQRHGGTLAVRSSPRPGHSRTVFTLFLPFEAVAH